MAQQRSSATKSSVVPVYCICSDGITARATSTLELFADEGTLRVSMKKTAFLDESDYKFSVDPTQFSTIVPWYTPPTNGDKYAAIFVPYFNFFKELLIGPDMVIKKETDLMVDVVPNNMEYSQIIRDAKTGELTTMAITEKGVPETMYMAPINGEKEGVVSFELDMHCSNAQLASPLELAKNPSAGLSPTRYFYDKTSGVTDCSVTNVSGNLVVKVQLENGSKFCSTFSNAGEMFPMNDKATFEETEPEFREFKYSDEEEDATTSAKADDCVYVTNIVSGTVCIIYFSKGEKTVCRHHVLRKDNLYRVYLDSDHDRLCYVYGKTGMPRDATTGHVTGPDEQLYVVDYLSKKTQTLQACYDVNDMQHDIYKVLNSSTPWAAFPPLADKPRPVAPPPIADLLPPAPTSGPLPADVLRDIASEDDSSEDDDEDDDDNDEVVMRVRPRPMVMNEDEDGVISTGEILSGLESMRRDLDNMIKRVKVMHSHF